MPNYPYLPPGRAILYVPESNIFMAAAKETALTSSTDQKIPTGAVIVSDSKQILTREANQSALKNKFLLETHKNWCIRKIFGVPSGKKYWLCPGCASSRNHAEYRAVKALQKKFGSNTPQDLDLYLWGHWWCCKPCWDKMLEINIRNVYLQAPPAN